MLFNLSIENIALIKKADINFNDGFTVLTGETGAGKSILIGSLNMLLGERVGKDLIRHGENYAYVEGLFYLDERAKKQLLEIGVEPDEDGSLIISRRLLHDGKNICKAGGKTVSVATLKNIGRNLINIHGQHDNQALLDEKTHISFLDEFCKKESQNIFLEYEMTYNELIESKNELKKYDIDENEKIRKQDILQFEIDEIKSANITLGEEENLKSLKNLVNDKELFTKNCAGALELLYEGEEVSAYSLISRAHSFFEKISDKGLDDLLEKVNELLYSIEDIASDIRKQLDKINFEEISLNDIEERLDLLYRLKRKYGQSEEEILQYLDNAQNELESITLSDSKKEELKKNIESLVKKAEKLAEKISDERKKNALIIESQINSQLSELNMDGAQFGVEFTKCDLSKKGIDEVEFLISTNRGEPKKALARIISGGELSRIMLALKTVFVEGDITNTLVFDEIDTGISGVTAAKVGTKLSDISKSKQVICVTHLPQIAALSDNHLKIEKQSDENETNTYIKVLDKDGKISEIAYMISGDETSKTSLLQAEEMVNKK